MNEYQPNLMRDDDTVVREYHYIIISYLQLNLILLYYLLPYILTLSLSIYVANKNRFVLVLKLLSQLQSLRTARYSVYVIILFLFNFLFKNTISQMDGSIHIKRSAWRML